MNHAKTPENTINNNNKIRNYINIENLNKNNSSYIYTNRTNTNNNELYILDKIEKNNIIDWSYKKTSSNSINLKSHRPIFYKLFSSYINSGENNSILYKNKNNKKVGNSIQLNSIIKNLNINKNSNSFY